MVNEERKLVSDNVVNQADFALALLADLLDFLLISPKSAGSAELATLGLPFHGESRGDPQSTHC